MRTSNSRHLNSFSQKEDIISSMNGWFDTSSLAVFDILLDLQFKNKIFGNILEIGTWEGKSASIFVDKLSKDEKIYLIDPELKTKKNIVRNNFKLIKDIADNNFLFFAIKSEKFRTNFSILL